MMMFSSCDFQFFLSKNKPSQGCKIKAIIDDDCVSKFDGIVQEGDWKCFDGFQIIKDLSIFKNACNSLNLVLLDETRITNCSPRTKEHMFDFLPFESILSGRVDAGYPVGKFYIFSDYQNLQFLCWFACVSEVQTMSQNNLILGFCVDLIGVVVDVGHLKPLENDPYRHLFGNRLTNMEITIRDMK